MKNNIVRLLVVLIALLSLAPYRAAAATYTPPGTICWYARNASFSSPLQYLCPVSSSNPIGVIGGTPGLSAYAFNDQVGFDIHFAYSNYSNFPYVLALLKSMNIHHVREGLAAVPGNSYVINSLNALGAAGIKADLITSINMTGSTIASNLSLLNTNAYDAIEAPNEQDICCGDGNWIANDRNQVINNNWPWVQANRPDLKVIGPSTGASNYAPLGDLSAYEDYGNTHDYEGGFPPETTGWGGPGYCGLNYASVAYNLCNAKQASVSKPVVATEFGYQVNPNQQHRTNYVDEGAQGEYLLRQIFQHMKLGMPRSYIYELIDSSGQVFGMVDSGHYQRRALREISGFMQILKDPNPLSMPCTVPAVVATAGVSSIGICKSDRTYALILWQPVMSWDTNAQAYRMVNTINAKINYNVGFLPSSLTQWSYNLASPWTNSGPISRTSIPVTDRPSIVIFNGSSAPTPVPAIPTPVPN